MIAARTIAVSYALIGWLIAPPLLAQTTQTAKANGPCSAAINAGAGATVFNKINCAAIDAKTKAAIKKLEAKGAQNTKVDRDQAQAITALKRSDESQEQRIKRLEESVAALLIKAQSPSASAEDVNIAFAVERGDAAAARVAYSESLELLQRLRAQDVESAALQRDLSISYERVGDVAFSEGDLAGARRAYSQSLALRQRLAAQDVGNVASQRDLSSSYDRLGDVAVAQGDLAAARTAYNQSLDLRHRLAAMDVGNVASQRDRSISLNKLGDVEVAQGDLAGARTAYAASLGIRERLAASDPGNAGSQRDLFVSKYKLAQVAEASGDVAGAIREYEAGEAILVALIARVGDHPYLARDLAGVRREIVRLRAK